MKTDSKIIIGAVLTSVVIIFGAFVVLGKDNAPKRETLGTASMSVDKKTEDFGSMKGDEERTATFIVKNTGDSVLRIWGIVTSCNCTFVTVDIAGTKTGEFNMAAHTGQSLRNWIGEVPKGGEAKLLVTYRPKVMPVTGAISRQVTFQSNDPKNSEVELSVSANVL